MSPELVTYPALQTQVYCRLPLAMLLHVEPVGQVTLSQASAGMKENIKKYMSYRIKGKKE